MGRKPTAAGFLVLWVVVGSRGLRAQPQNAQQVLTLPQAVGVALKNNPTLKAADAYGEAVREGIRQAQASRYPQVNFSEGFTRSNNPVYVFGTLLTQRQFTQANFALSFLNTPPPLNNFRTQFTASLPLYDAGQAGRRVRDARLEAQSARQMLERTTQEVIFSVINAYLNEVLARESVRVADASMNSTQDDLARAQARQQQGLALLSDVLSAEVQLAQAKEDLIRARNDAALAQATLNVAMGLPEDAPQQLKGSLSEPQFESGTLEERQRRALAMRPGYQQALSQKAKAANAVNMARAEFLPTISTFGSWELDNQTFASRGGNNWTAGATLNLNLFDGSVRRAQLAQTHLLEKQAEAFQAQMASAIRLQVRQAFLNLAAARERIEVSRQSASQAQESLRILRNRYETGLATIADVLGAETAHTRAQRDFLNAVYDYRLALATLELATGELAPNSPAVVG